MNDNSKINKIVKRNKYSVIAIAIFVVLLIVAYIGYKVFFPNNGTPVYGNRLDGITEVDFSKDELNTIVSNLEEKDAVVSAKIDESGKILNIIITVKEDTKSDDAKKIATEIISYVTDDQKAYFDFQVFIKNESEEAKGYPMIGYKNKTSDGFIFSQSEE